METVDFGRISIEIPADCPDKGAFASVVKETLRGYFGTDKSRAEFCRAEYDRCFGIPPEIACSPGARAWEGFIESVGDEISDYGSHSEYARIRGWDAPPLKSHLAPKQEQQQSAPPAERTWRLDKMKVVEPSRGRERGR